MQRLASLLSLGLVACSAPALVIVEGRDSAVDVHTVNIDASLPEDRVSVDARAEREQPQEAPRRPTPSCPDPSERGCQRMVITGGTMTLGTDLGAAAGPAQGPITVSPFVIDAAEATVARLQRFLDAWRAEALPEQWQVAYPNGATVTVRLSELPRADFQSNFALCNRDLASAPAQREHPANCLNWYVAMAFCAWDGGRVPTEAEYEWVARWWLSDTSSGRRYPWGDDPPVGRCDLAHWMDRLAGGICPGADGRGSRRVMSLSLGQTFGVFDLAGNASEWLADTFLEYRGTDAPNACWGLGAQRDPLCHLSAPALRVIRGGSGATVPLDPDRLLTVSRRGAMPDLIDIRNGVRCVRALDPAP
ncbi:MAG: SUMF1/EgtB/PvdO family nonheme iron enzyme [Myxococcales bacterium]|nr:SUMF1/EgtB/PvdO family nonheme iron enzyme [Myxococcales bacterium]